MAVQEITVGDVRAMTNPFLIDVREADEWEQGHIEGATLWPLSRLLYDELPDLPREQEIILYCQRGRRSLQAGEIFQINGFTKVQSMAGGYLAWVEQG